MSKISWIQLSDLHFGDNSQYSQKSQKALLEFLTSRHQSIDYIFVTGDIIFAKKLNTSKARKRAYAAAKEYLKKIYISLWGEKDIDKNMQNRIFIVPGNHDLVRDEARSAYVEKMLQSYTKERRGIIDQSYLKNTKQAMAAFKSFYKEIASPKLARKLDESIHYVIETDKLNVLHINTCIASSGDGDDGKLIIGFELLNKALDKISDQKPTVVIAHHNFDCFDDEEQKKLELLLKEKDIFLYLCGHAHERESNLILRYNQTKRLNTYTCGTLMSEDGEGKEIDTVFFYGEYDLDVRAGKIVSYIWNLANGWHDDKEFGLVQNISDNYRMFSSIHGESEHKIRLQFDGQEGIVAKIVSQQSSERNISFIEMNGRAEKSLSIYGVGITSVSRNTELFDKILNNGGAVKLCMVNPDIFKTSVCDECREPEERLDFSKCGLDSTNFCIYSSHIDQYVRTEYYEDIQRSYKRLLAYQKAAKDKQGEFSIKLLNSFIPLSINIINENTDDAELIIEYNMPFTSKRLLLQLGKRDNNDYYSQIKNIFDVIWGRGENIL